MNGLSVLLLGLGLGLRHATDADHVVVISTLLQREPGTARAARIAALWGVGHTAAFLGVGLLVVLAGLRIPDHFDRIAEMLVASMLLGFGALHLKRSFAKEEAVSAEGSSTPSTSVRPVAVGVVHGLAGSAAIALLASTTIDSRVLAASYLGLFGLGTVLGMVLLTILMSGPITWTMRRPGHARRVISALAALLSLGLGAVFLIEAVVRNSGR